MIYELPDFMLAKDWRPRQSSLIELKFNINAHDPFVIRCCTKNGSTTIKKIHYHIHKPKNYPTDYNEYSEMSTNNVLRKIVVPITNKSIPLYCFYRDPIERFISSSNFAISYIKNKQSDWVAPDNINDMIQFIFEYKIYARDSIYGWDIFWPQTFFLRYKEEYTETYNIKYINEFFKSRNINVDELGSEKTDIPKIFFKEQISTENLNILKYRYSVDYEWGWY